MGRTQKYAAKLNPEIIGQRYEDTKELAIRKQTKYFGDAVKLQNKIKVFVDGQPSFLYHYYMDYGEELVKKKTEAEWRITFEKWRLRGLNMILLNNLCAFLTGYAPAGEVCLFDIGRFDVNTYG